MRPSQTTQQVAVVTGANRAMTRHRGVTNVTIQNWRFGARRLRSIEPPLPSPLVRARARCRADDRQSADVVVDGAMEGRRQRR